MMKTATVIPMLIMLLCSVDALAQERKYEVKIEQDRTSISTTIEGALVHPEYPIESVNLEFCEQFVESYFIRLGNIDTSIIENGSELFKQFFESTTMNDFFAFYQTTYSVEIEGICRQFVAIKKEFEEVPPTQEEIEGYRDHLYLEIFQFLLTDAFENYSNKCASILNNK